MLKVQSLQENKLKYLSKTYDVFELPIKIRLF